MSDMIILEEPKGIGSIIRVVFKYPGIIGVEAFYVGVAPGLWVGYGSNGEDEFTWEEMLDIVQFDEAAVFEVVYEGFGTIEADDTQHPKDWIWRQAL